MRRSKAEEFHLLTMIAMTEKEGEGGKDGIEGESENRRELRAAGRF